MNHFLVVVYGVDMTTDYLEYPTPKRTVSIDIRRRTGFCDHFRRTRAPPLFSDGIPTHEAQSRLITCLHSNK